MGGPSVQWNVPSLGAAGVAVWRLSAEEDGKSRVGASGSSGEVVDHVAAVLGGGGDDAGDDSLGPGAGGGAVASEGLPVDDAGPDGLFAVPVRGLDTVCGEESEQVRSLVGEVLEQSAVGVGARCPCAQPLQAGGALGRRFSACWAGGQVIASSTYHKLCAI